MFFNMQTMDFGGFKDIVSILVVISILYHLSGIVVFPFTTWFAHVIYVLFQSFFLHNLYVLHNL